jgi:putative oxidoreductase
MIRKLCTADDKTAAVILRLVLGVVFFAHEAQKMLGWFGGYLVEGRPFGRVVLTI